MKRKNYITAGSSLCLSKTQGLERKIYVASLKNPVHLNVIASEAPVVGQNAGGLKCMKKELHPNWKDTPMSQAFRRSWI